MATYKIDASHSDIIFKVKHLMITTVTGQFKTFDATLSADAHDFSDAAVTFTADINSVDTRSEQRDTHLKSDDFFAADKFPELKFVSTSVAKKEDGLVVKGDLTIRDITKPIELKADFNGVVVDPWGQTKVGFEAEGKIKRKEFGLGWDAVTEAGGIVVSDEVKLQFHVQFVKQ
ncbi:MAG: YceI family protein [Chitinophagaceae bacterium]|jgi:polyisoprenoid-binding protein YceI|nr:YceI family protein [Chitinophagaceae bacterium]